MKTNRYVADFETSAQNWLEKDKFARVWLACCVSVGESPNEKFYSTNIDDFMKNVENLGNCDIYFHNLKFDGQYIVDWLIKNHFKYSRNGENKSYYTVISSGGDWYKIVVVYKKYAKTQISTTFYDSLKKIPMSVEKIAEAFDFEQKKGIIDYDKYRPIDYMPTQEEIEYIKNDCIIVAKALDRQFKNDLDGITIGCDAMHYFKNLIGHKQFEYLFPELTTEVDAQIRNSYRGGYVNINKKYKNSRINGIAFDVNSLFPSVMVLTPHIRQITGANGLPYGVPLSFKGEYEKDEEYPLFIQKFACEFKLKRGHLPTLQAKNYCFGTDTEYLTSSNDKVLVLTLTNIDYELFLENYDVCVLEYYGGLKFKSSDCIFIKYVEHWYSVKQNTIGGQRQIAKLMLNSLYGKFATRPDKTNLMPKKTENGFDLVVDEKSIIEDGKTIYTAMASFITSIARCYIVKLAEMFGDNWVYSDTDSLYLTNIDENKVRQLIEIDKYKLGAFKVEHIFDDAKFLRAKTYILHDLISGNNNQIEITCAGMPDKIKESFIDNAKSYQDAFSQFDYNKNFTRLMPKRVDGGVVLVQENFTIRF